jgi:hypothetical protein
MLDGQAAWAVLGLCTAAATAAATFSGRRPEAMGAHLFCWLLAGFTWLCAVALVAAAAAAARPPQARPGGRAVAWLWICALLLRAPAWLEPPRHSDDVYRYLWDGAAGRAGLSPYLGPPGDPAYAALRAAHPTIYARINHRHLPTIYPPAAQLGFRAGTLLGGLPGWKAVVAACDLLVLLILLRACRRLGRDPRWAAIWGWSPLCAVELAQDAHMDVLGILPLCLLLCLVLPRAPEGGRRARPYLAAGALLSTSLLVKPLGVALLPGLLSLGGRRLRALALGALLAAAALLLPHLQTRVQGSLGEYGRRWRGNDGAYALVHRAVEAAVARAYPPPYDWPWPRNRLAPLFTGRARDAVYPDELAGALSRGAVGALWLLLFFSQVRRRSGLAESALVLISAYLLLTPMLHPWYALWALPFCLFAPSRSGPALLLCLCAPLAHTGTAWGRLIEHGAAWLAAALCLAQGRGWPADLTHHGQLHRLY